MDSADVVCVFAIRTLDSQISVNKLAARHFDPLRVRVANSPRGRFGGSVRSCFRYRYGRTIVGKALDLLRIVLGGWWGRVLGSILVKGRWSVLEVAWNCEGIPLRKTG